LHCTWGTMMNIWIKMLIIEFRGKAQIYHVSSRFFFYFIHTPSQWQSHFSHSLQPFKQLIIFMSSSTGDEVPGWAYNMTCIYTRVSAHHNIIVILSSTHFHSLHHTTYYAYCNYSHKPTHKLYDLSLIYLIIYELKSIQ